jgi:hypothetical protein
MKYALALALLLFALPAKADSGNVTVNVTGYADFPNGVLDATFSWDLTNMTAVSLSSGTEFAGTAQTQLELLSFIQTGSLGPFTPVALTYSDPEWSNGAGYVFDAAMESLEAGPNGGSYIELEIIGPNGPAYLPQDGFGYTVSEVPEASTWIMLLAGFAGLLLLGKMKAFATP